METLAFISPGGGEFILTMLVLIMLFGAKEAPKILRKIQSVFDEVRRIANGFRYDVMYSDLDSNTPKKPNSDESEIVDGEFEPCEFDDHPDCDDVIDLSETEIKNNDEISEENH